MLNLSSGQVIKHESLNNIYMQFVINKIMYQGRDIESTTLKGSCMHSLVWMAPATGLVWLFSFYVKIILYAGMSIAVGVRYSPSYL